MGLVDLVRSKFNENICNLGNSLSDGLGTLLTSDVSLRSSLIVPLTALAFSFSPLKAAGEVRGVPVEFVGDYNPDKIAKYDESVFKIDNNVKQVIINELENPSPLTNGFREHQLKDIDHVNLYISSKIVHIEKEDAIYNVLFYEYEPCTADGKSDSSFYYFDHISDVLEDALIRLLWTKNPDYFFYTHFDDTIRDSIIESAKEYPDMFCEFGSDPVLTLTGWFIHAKEEQLGIFPEEPEPTYWEVVDQAYEELMIQANEFGTDKFVECVDALKSLDNESVVFDTLDKILYRYAKKVTDEDYEAKDYEIYSPQFINTVLLEKVKLSDDPDVYIDYFTGYRDCFSKEQSFKIINTLINNINGGEWDTFYPELIFSLAKKHYKIGTIEGDGASEVHKFLNKLDNNIIRTVLYDNCFLSDLDYKMNYPGSYPSVQDDLLYRVKVFNDVNEYTNMLKRVGPHDQKAIISQLGELLLGLYNGEDTNKKISTEQLIMNVAKDSEKMGVCLHINKALIDLYTKLGYKANMISTASTAKGRDSGHIFGIIDDKETGNKTIIDYDRVVETDTKYTDKALDFCKLGGFSYLLSDENNEPLDHIFTPAQKILSKMSGIKEPKDVINIVNGNDEVELKDFESNESQLTRKSRLNVSVLDRDDLDSRLEKAKSFYITRGSPNGHDSFGAIEFKHELEKHEYTRMFWTGHKTNTIYDNNGLKASLPLVYTFMINDAFGEKDIIHFVPTIKIGKNSYASFSEICPIITNYQNSKNTKIVNSGRIYNIGNDNFNLGVIDSVTGRTKSLQFDFDSFRTKITDHDTKGNITEPYTSFELENNNGVSVEYRNSPSDKRTYVKINKIKF